MQWGKGLMHAREKYGNLQASESSLPSALRIFRAYTTRFQLFPTERAAVCVKKQESSFKQEHGWIYSTPVQGLEEDNTLLIPIAGKIETNAAGIRILTFGLSFRYQTGSLYSEFF